MASIPAPDWILDSTFVFLLAMLVCGVAGYLSADTPHPRRAAGRLGVRQPCGLAAPRPQLGTVGRGAHVHVDGFRGRDLGQAAGGPGRSAEDRAAHLEQEQAEAARQAVIDERQRIARELHDIIAHSVSVMTVQAGAVRRRLTPDQTRERDSLVAVERTGREALAEMRRLVGLLHDETEPDYAPQPGMQALDSLLATVRAAGLPVDLEVEGTQRELPPGVDLAAYRIVQEALTNTMKYAGPARAWVQIGWSEDELRIEVANNGRNTAKGSGYGQAGMQERLRLYGGRLETGPRPDGGYVVRAFVPIGSTP